MLPMSMTRAELKQHVDELNQNSQQAKWWLNMYSDAKAKGNNAHDASEVHTAQTGPCWNVSSISG